MIKWLTPKLRCWSVFRLFRMCRIRLVSLLIGWLRDEKDIELCEDYPVPEGGYGTDGGFHPTHQRVEALLAGFFEIDLGQVEAERRAILDFLSEQQG